MVLFSWLTSSAAAAAAQTAVKLERMRLSEQRLLEFAKAYAHRPWQSPQADVSGAADEEIADAADDSWLDIQTFDTRIPRSAVAPLQPTTVSKKNEEEDDDSQSLIIHGVHVQARRARRLDSNPSSSSGSTTTTTTTTDTPLVLLHGYMNAGAYFYRNLGGLAHYYTNIYALDMLGWGLSSRPSMKELVDRNNRSLSIDTAEDFFVESLEAWRAAHDIDRMILCGHSMGGYMSVAYTERYPERVERLLLLSPVGVPDENDPAVQERRQRFQSTWRGRAFFGFFRTFFERTTIGSVLRNYLGEERAYRAAHNYVQQRLPEIIDAEESKTVADYLYYNAVLPGSGEFFVHNVLNSLVMARRPLLYRIPNLQVNSVTFFYGSTDWMDLSGGLNTQKICERIQHQHEEAVSSHGANANRKVAPDVSVFLIPAAGHLLMLQNPLGTNAGMIHAGGGHVPTDRLPRLLKPTASSDVNHEGLDKDNRENEEDHRLQSLWLQQTLLAREEAAKTRKEASEAETVVA